VEPLLALAAALLALRLAGRVLGRWRARRTPELLAWGSSLLAYSAASAALAWGAAAGWDARAFRVYYLGGGLLTAPLLGAGLALGVAIAVPIHAAFGEAIPAAQDHLDFFQARLIAVAGNSLGTLAVIVVAAATFRGRPLGNTLIVAGVSVAAVGSALAGLGEAESAAFAAVAVVLLYAGFVSRR
jgi:hypothetical protein